MTASVVRGAIVGLGVFVVTIWFASPQFAAPLWIVAFGLLGAAMLGTLGLIAGIWADKFDQLAGFQNFIVMPATFLSAFSTVQGCSVWVRSRTHPFST